MRARQGGRVSRVPGRKRPLVAAAAALAGMATAAVQFQPPIGEGGAAPSFPGEGGTGDGERLTGEAGTFPAGGEGASGGTGLQPLPPPAAEAEAGSGSSRFWGRELGPLLVVGAAGLVALHFVAAVVLVFRMARKKERRD